jgi:hypothetical protein
MIQPRTRARDPEWHSVQIGFHQQSYKKRTTYDKFLSGTYHFIQSIKQSFSYDFVTLPADCPTKTGTGPEGVNTLRL